jgi:hypothetical protein
MVSPEGHSHERCSGYLGWPFFLVISLTYDEESKTEELAKEFVLWEKRLSPRRAPKRSLLPLSPRRTQVRLKPLLYQVSGYRQICFRHRGGLYSARVPSAA